MTKTALVILAHPCQKSYTASLRDTAVKKLKDMGFEVLESDLYKMKFNPVVDSQDFDEPKKEGFFSVSDEMKKAYDKNELEKDIVEEIKKVDKADYIFFVCPLWCGSFPAIMKGWMERVMQRGFAFDMNHFFEKGYLKGKKAGIIVTTGAPREFFQKKGPHTAGMDINENFMHMMISFSWMGMDSLPVFATYAVEMVDESERKDYIKELDSWLGNIENIKRYENPELSKQSEEQQEVTTA